MTTDDSKYFDASNSESIDELGTQDCATLPPIFPIDIQNLQPLRIAVSFTLMEWTCVYRELYQEHAVGSIDGAISRLLKFNEVFLIYRLYSEVVTPAWAFTVDWPLRRRGKLTDSVIREVPHGNEIELANAIFEIRNHPLGPYKSRLMLKTGGRTPEDAVRRWTALAMALRQQVRNSTP